jgi:hypothetical protein
MSRKRSKTAQEGDFGDHCKTVSQLDSLLKYAFAPTKEGHHPVK